MKRRPCDPGDDTPPSILDNSLFSSSLVKFHFLFWFFGLSVYVNLKLVVSWLLPLFVFALVTAIRGGLSQQP
ncbi:hypothetical protein BGZ63DRAFT_382777 [Mariannaea sp. PMI_226]|nr:hypothetical protein BGZ63DRAFT_382777 [Mariannaea sp. PMI_226]